MAANLMNKIKPIRRDLKFKLPAERIGNWHPMGENVSQLLNAFSVFLPVGERFFIHAVRHYRDNGAITDPALLADMKAFIGQEAMHGREHDDYNAAMAAAGLPVKSMEARIATLLEFVKDKLPPSSQLGATIALEHMTALLGAAILRDPELMSGDTEANFRALWRWHALEETEHKAVAYDVYVAAVGQGGLAYANRVLTMAIAMAIFWPLFAAYHVRLVQLSGGLFNLRGWWRAHQFMWGRPGLIRNLLGEYFDYFKPGFHPWQHDNSAVLTEMGPLEHQYQRAA